MRALTSQTRALLDQLNARPSLLTKLRGEDKRAELIRELGDSGEPSVVPYLLPFVLILATRGAALAGVASLLEEASSRQLYQLHEIRGFGSLYGTPRSVCSGWFALGPNDLVDLDYDADESAWILGLATFHYSGYTREAAVKRLSTHEPRLSLPFLFLRLNDWVQQVRTAALNAIETVIDNGELVDLAHNLPHLGRLKLAGRADHSVLIRSVEEALLSEDRLSALMAATKSPDRYVRRAAYQLLWSAGTSDVKGMAQGGLKDADVSIRTEAARYICANSTTADEVLTLAGDGLAAVRRVALRHLHERGGVASETLLPFLMDSCAGIRSETSFHLRRMGWNEFRPFYQERIHAGKPREVEAAILGLSENGGPEVLKDFEGFLKDEKTRVRRAAVVGFARLCEKEDAEVVVRALSDQSPSVSHAARDGLIARDILLSSDQLLELVQSAQEEHAQRNAVLLARMYSRWLRVAVLLEALRVANQSVRPVIIRLLERWISRSNKSFVIPSSSQTDRIRSALDAVSGQSEEPLREIGSILEHWSSDRASTT